MLQQAFDDSRCRLAIPILWDATAFPIPFNNLNGLGDDFLTGRSYKSARALGYGHGPVGVLAKGQAGNTKHGRLLLDAARIGQDELRATHQAERIQITERFDDSDVRPMI